MFKKYDLKESINILLKYTNDNIQVGGACCLGLSHGSKGINPFPHYKYSLPWASFFPKEIGEPYGIQDPQPTNSSVANLALCNVVITNRKEDDSNNEVA